MSARETVFTMDTSSIKYGPGATRELGADMAALGARRVMLLTDANLVLGEQVAVARDSLKRAGIDAVPFSRVRVEPDDASFREAIAFAQNGDFDGYVAVGGGSVMDTAKVANLYACWPPDDFLDYVNPPIGRGLPVPGALKPLGRRADDGRHRQRDHRRRHLRLRGHARQDRHRPSLVATDAGHHRPAQHGRAAAHGGGLQRAGRAQPRHRVADRAALFAAAGAGASGIAARVSGRQPGQRHLAAQALRMVGANLLRAIQEPDDEEARGNMLLAAASAGIGFGNAGVHLPHGMSYPVSGMVRDFLPQGYRVSHAIVPHGMAVILNAPAVFRFTARANPERHLLAARLLGLDVTDARPQDAGEILAAGIIDVMRATGMPNGLAGVGYREADAPALADGALPQHRVTKLSPRPADRDDLIELFRAAMRYW